MNRRLPMKKEEGMYLGMNAFPSRNTMQHRTTIAIGNPIMSNTLPFHTSADKYTSQHWNTHAYEANHMVSRYKESMSPPETTFNRWYSNNNTLQSLQKPPNNTAMLHAHPEICKNSSVPDFTSAFAQQKNLSSEGDNYYFVLDISFSVIPIPIRKN